MDMQVFNVAQAMAVAYDAPAAWIAAIIAKESNGEVFATANGNKLPLIRWEGHYFYQRLKGDKLAAAVAKKLASPKAGGIKNPREQADRWYKLVEPACGIDTDAAHESMSWGVGQVMGAHWKRLGFASVADLVKTACSGLYGQVDLMMRYIKEFALLDELRRGDALGFSRGYNGPKTPASYARDIERLAKEFGGEVKTAGAANMLRMGMKGAKVRELQALLNRTGAAVKVDGDFGPTTKAAVLVFQRKSGLAADGVAGPETMQALAAYRVAPDEQLGVVGPLQTAEARQGGTSAGTGVLALEAAKQVQPYVDQLNQTADKLQSLASLSDLAGYATAALYVAGGLLIIGGLVWAAAGWIRSRRTVGGV
ncbi:N-acetylmuramidase domain-containing protein [Pleomorphomonas koreensis]|uniref:N-acetylmuramidase domain-containing protein n=1 Tax=Pleomorphomonas koreensis TaxID=257440 RepID=UPI00041AB023|nr:N-acetylmuramidase domain-containing protein [Pleomorphomonas koreensis]